MDLYEEPPMKLGPDKLPVGLFDKGSEWDSWPDFVALDFNEKRIQIVEVSKTSTVSEAKGKIEKYKDGRHDSWIRQVLAPNLEQFPITRRLFVRRAVRDKLGHVNAQITSLEDVFDSMRDRMP